MIPEIKLDINPYTGLLEPEVWKDIVGYEGYYQVSNYGRVKGLSRLISRERRGAGPIDLIGPIDLKSEQLRTQYLDRQGYFTIQLYKNNKPKSFGAHRLAAQAFIPNPNNKPQVNHKRGIKTDNRIWELEWVTRSENQKHSHRIGLVNFKGENHPKSKLTLLQVGVIREAMACGHRLSTIARYFKVHRGTILCIKDGRNWRIT